MERTEVAPNYPAEPEKSNSVVIALQISKSSLYIHRELLISVDVLTCHLGISCAQFGHVNGEETVIASMVAFETEKGINLETKSFGRIKFPDHFEYIGEIDEHR